MSLSRRTFLQRAIAVALASALPAGHVATALAAESAPEPIAIAPGVDVLDGPPPAAARAVFAGARGRVDIRALADDVFLDFDVAAHADGSGELRFGGLIDRGVGDLSPVETVIALDAAAFRPLWELLFARHYRIVDAAELGRHPLDHAITPVRTLDAVDIDYELEVAPHAIVYGGRDQRRKVEAAGFDRIIHAGRYPSSRWFAARMEPVEPHWPAWVIDEGHVA